jgi:hypothetical protein
VVTPYSALIAAARFHIRAAKGAWPLTPGSAALAPSQSGAITTPYSVDPFWSDDELFDIAKRGTTDLWAAFIDIHQEHFLTIDTTNVSLQSNATQLTGVPLDCFRVYCIEPLDPTTNDCAFIPRPYNHVEFINARAYSATIGQAFFPTAGVNIFYCMAGVGPPQGAPVILTAPQITVAVPLRFSYIPILSTQNYTVNTLNPIPGESDNAIIAWIVAYARGKERDDRSPDPAWLSVYATEKSALLTRAKPRQEQEAIYADGIMDQYWRS